ncbi:hypothetical protein GCM10027287_52250 [Bordetella muralis]
MTFDLATNPEAASAMSAIEALELTPDPTQIGSQIAPIMDRYGVNPSAQVDVIQRIRGRLKPGMTGDDLNPFVREAVGRAVADPRVAGEQAREAVTEAGQTLKGDDLRQHAVQVAGQKAAMTGASSQDAEVRTQKYLDQGMSPSAAAQAGAMVAVARHMGFPEGFEIFGRLTARVSGLVIETNRGREEKTVTNETVWDIDQSLVQTAIESYAINCHNYKATADHDVSSGNLSMGFHWGGYQMFSPQPISLTGLSVGAAATLNTAYVTSMQGTPYRLAIPMAGDFYATLVAVSATGKAKGAETREVSKQLLDICIGKYVVYDSLSSTVSDEAVSAMEAVQTAKKAGKWLAAALLVSGGAVAASAVDVSNHSE